MKNDIYLKLKNGRKIKLRYACDEVTPETYFDHLHEHNFCEICIMLSGEMIHTANGKPYALHRGDVFFCRPGEFHYAFCREASVYERFAIWLPRYAFSELATDSLGFFDDVKLANRNVIRVRGNRQEAFEALLETAKPVIAAGKRADQLTAYGKVAEIISFISAEAAAFAGEAGDAPSGYIHPIVNRTILYVRDNFKTVSGIDEIADKLHINRDYLSRIFRRYTGITLHEYLKNTKLNYSKSLLIQGRGVTETAFACGFNSTSYFIRVFRENVGMTPSEYRKSGKQIVTEAE